MEERRTKFGWVIFGVAILLVYITLTLLLAALIHLIRSSLPVSPGLPAISATDQPAPLRTPVSSGVTRMVTDCARFGDRAAAGTLGAALAAAGNGDIIRFSCGGHLHLASSGPAKTAITISHDLTIDATGYDVTLDGDGQVQIFSVHYPAAVALTHLTIIGGQAQAGGALYNDGGSVLITDCAFLRNHLTTISDIGDEGGAIMNAGTLTVTTSRFAENSVNGGTSPPNAGGGDYSQPGPGGDGVGGAVSNYGTLRITASTFTANIARGGQGGPSFAAGGNGEGGAIYNAGTLSLDRDALLRNSAIGGADNGFAQGGALFNDTAGTLTITNSTLFGNQAIASDHQLAEGGALSTLGAADISYSTIAGNAVRGGTAHDPVRGGAIVNAGTLRLRGTLLATSIGAPNCALLGGTLSDVGHNQEDGASCGFSASRFSYQKMPAGLAATPGTNGGPTPTLALLPSSPARDAGGTPADGCPATDQRGVARPQGAACDIGAYEASR